MLPKNMYKLLLCFSLLCCSCLYAATSSTSDQTDNISEESTPTQDATIKNILDDKLEEEQEKSTEVIPTKSLDYKLVSFRYTDKPLVDIINELAAAYKFNVMLPQVNVLTTKVTYNIPEKITLKQAWEYLTAILDLAGYAWEERNNMLVLVKVDPTIRQDTLPLYINEPLENLPDTEEIIRAIFYLSNMKVADTALNLTGNDGLLKAMLSSNAAIMSDSKTNALILTDKSNYIKSAMQVVRELDLNGIRESLEVLPLYYTQASFVQDLFKSIYPSDSTGGAPTQAQSTYFPRNTKVLALDRINSIAIMGSTKAIDKVRDFIIKYIDRPLESGESILHIYDLQYLNAQEFLQVLQKLLESSATGQGTSEATSGPRKDFKNVLIAAENAPVSAALKPTETKSSDGSTPQPTPSGIQQGGNRLIIAAQKNDWLRIKKLIDDLDKPQPQVALEVLVVDLNLTEGKLLGSQMRNKASFNDSVDKNVNFQTAMLAPPVLIPAQVDTTADLNDFENFPANALMANLLQFSTNVDNNNTNIANTAPNGSLIISFNDPQTSGIWNVWQILNQFTNVSMLAQPFIITANNVQASIAISESRLLPGPAEVQNGGIVQRNEQKDASISIDLLPRISANNNINLQVMINVDEYLSDAGNRATRLVQTNANIGNGEVLALGGLIKLTDNINLNETPLLSKIPIVGWFFKNKFKTRIKNNLIVFICPTIIQPKVGGGVDTFTKKKLHLAEDQLEDHKNFENLRDPITRWFFQPDINLPQRVITNYVHGELDRTECAEVCQHIQPDPVKACNKNYQAEEVRLKELAQRTSNPLLRVKHG